MTEKLLERRLHAGAESLRLRRRALDRVTSILLLALLLAVLLPWLVRGVALELGQLAWALSLFALASTAASWLLDRVLARRRLLLGMAVQQGALVVFLALYFHMAGGLRFPGLLLAFLVPAFAPAALGFPRLALGNAALAAGAVTLVALLESPGLRWYVVQIGLPAAAGLRLFPDRLIEGGDPFPSLTLDPPYEAALATTFVLLLAVTSLVAADLPRRLLAIASRTHAADALEGELRDLLATMLRSSSEPAALVFADGGHVLHVSRSFLNQLLLSSADIPGATLFELVAFEEPEPVRRLFARGGELGFVRYRVGPEERAARLTVDSFRHAGASYALVRVLDHDERSLMALQSVERGSP